MKMAFRTLSGAWIISSVLLLSVGPAQAQTPEERAGARSAAHSGLDAYNGGKYADSLDLFTRAENLVHAPTHLLYIARSNLKLGRLVRAQEAYQQLAREKLPADAPQPFREAQQSAERELAGFEGRIPNVTVRITGGVDTSQVKVTMDGKVIPSALVGIPFPADPGMHKFAATAPGFTAGPVDKPLPEGGRDTVELQLVASANSPTVPAGTAVPATVAGQPAATGPAATTVNMTPAASTSTHNKNIPAYALLGVGVVGIGVGTGFLFSYFSASTKADDAYNECVKKPATCSPTSDARKAVDSLDSKASTKGLISAVSFTVGGLAAAGGVTLLILNGNSSDKSTAMEKPTVRGWVGPASLGLSGQF